MTYDNDICNQFVTDMEDAGFVVEHYHGRFSWQGPAVRTGDPNCITSQDIIRATNVRLQSDNMGLESIWYPARSGKIVAA